VSEPNKKGVRKMKKQAKKARMERKLAEMMADGWTEIGALEVLVMHGYGDVIQTDWVI
jgi:hypothetical protein